MTDADKTKVRDLRESVKWIEKLIRDLETGKAKVVPTALSGHVWEHLEPEPTLHLHELEGLLTTDRKITRTVHVDILKPWAVYLYIADCPKTGIRFVEDSGSSRLVMEG